MISNSSLVKTYIIHLGHKNLKVRGTLIETFNSQTGQRFLSGTQILKTLHWRDKLGKTKVDEAVADFRMEITNLSYTVKG